MKKMKRNNLPLLTLCVFGFVSCTNRTDNKPPKTVSPYEKHAKEIIALEKSGDKIFKINDTIKSLVKFISNPENKNKFLKQKFYSSDLVGVQIVSVIYGRRYTVYYTGDSLPNKHYYLTFWVRPDGTRNHKFVSRFTDNNLDGFVDYGHRDYRNRDNYNNFSNGTFYIYRKTGSQYEKYWQVKYRNAVRVFFDFYKIPMKI